jgi:hypothetical protein
MEIERWESELTKPKPPVLKVASIMVYLEQYFDRNTFIYGTSLKAAAIPPFPLPLEKSSRHSSGELYAMSLDLSNPKPNKIRRIKESLW